MTTTLYQDGFPKSPLEAINYSYFLTDAEKVEWKEWVQTATPEQQQELVDTLHEMWQNNQQQVVPSGFESTMPLPSLQANGEPIPTADKNEQALRQFDQAQEKFTANNNIAPTNEPVAPTLTPNQMGQLTTPQTQQIEEFDPAFDPTQQYSTSPSQAETSNSINKSILDDQQVKDFGSGPFVSNPILNADESQPTSQNNKTQPQQASSEQQMQKSQSQRNSSRNQPNLSARATNQPAEKSNEQKEQKFFKVANVREAATKKALEDIYKQYLASREKSFSSEREYQEFHGMFLDKVMQVVVNFEQVADYFESMTHKLLEMNDTIVQQAALITEVQTKTSRINNDIELRVDEIERDVDRIYRELKVMKNDYRDFEDNVQGLLAQSGADVYSKDGVLQRIDLVTARLHKLEQNVKPAPTSNLREQVNSKIASLQQVTEPQKPASQVRRQNQPPTVVGDASKTTIDLRNKI